MAVSIRFLCVSYFFFFTATKASINKTATQELISGIDKRKQMNIKTKINIEFYLAQ